jgi:hypothetical protein
VADLRKTGEGHLKIFVDAIGLSDADDDPVDGKFHGDGFPRLSRPMIAASLLQV